MTHWPGAPQLTAEHVRLTPRLCGLPPRPHSVSEPHLAEDTPGLQLTLDIRETKPVTSCHSHEQPLVAGGYLLSSTDFALLTFSKSSTERVSRTCFCCAASSRRHS